MSVEGEHSVHYEVEIQPVPGESWLRGKRVFPTAEAAAEAYAGSKWATRLVEVTTTRRVIEDG